MSLKLAPVSLIGIILFLAAIESSRAEFDEFLSMLPADANAVIVINVEKMMSSPYAVENGWKNRHAAAYAQRPILVPPDAQAIALASQVDTLTMDPLWQVGIMKMGQSPDMNLMAKAEGGHVEQLAGVEAVWSPMDLFYVKLRPNVLGIMHPADRQVAARWIQYGSEKREVTLSPYLASSARYVPSVGTEIIMALDLKHVVNPKEVRNRLREFEAIKANNYDAGFVDRAAVVLESLQGVTLGVRIGKSPFGAIKIDFDAEASTLADVAKPMLIEILNSFGAQIDEIKNWKVVVKDKRITVQGKLTESGMMRIFSVLELPPPLSHDSDTESNTTTSGNGQPTQQPSESAVALASQKYFKSVNRLINDIRYKEGAKTIAQKGLWMGKYARRIDRLPILNVDADLLDYGAYVAEQLRNSSQAVRQVGIETAKRKSQIHSYQYGVGSQYRGSAWGGSGRSSSWYRRGGHRYGGRSYYGYEYAGRRGAKIQAGERRRVAQEEKAKGATTAIEIMTNIDNATAQVRRGMTERYQVEFR